MARVFRVHHPGLQPAAGAAVVIDGPEAHHVLRVLRLRTGEPLAVFDGSGIEWRGTIVGQERDRLTVRLDEPVLRSVEAACELTLFQGACQADRLDWMVQKATEIGVAAIAVVHGERARREPADRRRLPRLRRIALEACKQSGRRRVPSIDEIDGLPAASGLALLLDPGSPVPLAAACPRDAPPRAALAVGPEGGFGPEDLDRAVAQGWRAVGLGPRILRSETAGLVAAAILLHRFDDLGRGGLGVD